MKNRVTELPPKRLRSVDEDRLIDRPLSARRSVLRGPWRKKVGPLVWLAGLAAVAGFFALGG